MTPWPITAAPSRAWRRALACAVLALAGLAPAATHALTLAQLLEMPLERLLQLRIGGRS